MKKQKGLGLIGALLIIGALLLTAGGVVVWEKKAMLKPRPMPTPAPTTILPSPQPSPVVTKKVGVTCTADSDCFLTDARLFTEDTCWPGACSGLDYSLNIIIGVNRNSFQRFMQSYQEECGPPPSCPQKIVSANFEAKCISGICQKVAEGSETSEGCIGQLRANWQCPREKWLDLPLGTRCCGDPMPPNLVCCAE